MRGNLLEKQLIKEISKDVLLLLECMLDNVKSINTEKELDLLKRQQIETQALIDRLESIKKEKI